MSDMRDNMELGTWGTFRAGWWILHAVSTLVIGWAGYRLGRF